MTEQEKLLRKLERLERKLDTGDWNLLALMNGETVKGVKAVIVGIDDIITPEVNGLVPNPEGSLSTLKRNSLIEPRSRWRREFQDSPLYSTALRPSYRNM